LSIQLGNNLEENKKEIEKRLKPQGDDIEDIEIKEVVNERTQS